MTTKELKEKLLSVLEPWLNVQQNVHLMIEDKRSFVSVSWYTHNDIMVATVNIAELTVDEPFSHIAITKYHDDRYDERLDDTLDHYSDHTYFPHYFYERLGDVETALMKYEGWLINELN